MTNIARPTKIWDQTLNDWVFLAGVVDTTKSYTYTADQTFPGITATSYNGGGIPARNLLINGGCDIWQRGTSASMTSTTVYLADRWESIRGGFAGGMTVSRQSAGLSGFQYCARIQRDSGNTSVATMYHSQTLETINSIPLQGQTVTLSFWARAGANLSSTGTYLQPQIESSNTTDQPYRAIGDGSGTTVLVNSIRTLTTSWQRFTTTATIPSNASQVFASFKYAPTGTAGAADYYEITGIQLEIGSVSTLFSRVGANIQQEIGICQRYYWQTTSNPNGAVTLMTGGLASGTTNVAQSYCAFPSPMRTIPTASINSTNLQFWDATGGGAAYSVGSILAQNSSIYQGTLNIASSGLTNNNRYNLLALTGSTGFLAFSAEL